MLLRVIAFGAALFFSSQAFAQFATSPAVELEDGGRVARLVGQLSFKDSSGRNWIVPANTVVDGASIPAPFRPLMGSPWNGGYRNAAIILDYYSGRKTRAWRDVHRVFYEGMISGGVEPLKAKLMYFAVYKFGPRWEQKATRVLGTGFDGRPQMIEQTITVDVPPAEYDPNQVEAMQRALEESDLSLEEIEAFADAA